MATETGPPDTRDWTCPTCGAEYTLADRVIPVVDGITGRVRGQDGAVEETREPDAAKITGTATDAQVRAIYGRGKEFPGGMDAVKNIMMSRWRVETPEALTKERASRLLDYLGQGGKPIVRP